MIALHVLSFIFGAAMVLAILGSALKTVVLPQEGMPRLSQAVFALVYRVLVIAHGPAPVRSDCERSTPRWRWSASRSSGCS